MRVGGGRRSRSAKAQRVGNAQFSSSLFGLSNPARRAFLHLSLFSFSLPWTRYFLRAPRPKHLTSGRSRVDPMCDKIHNVPCLTLFPSRSRILTLHYGTRKISSGDRYQIAKCALHTNVLRWVHNCEQVAAQCDLQAVLQPPLQSSPGPGK